MSNYTVREFQSADAIYFPEFTALGIDPTKVPQPAATGLYQGDPVGCAGIVVIRPGLGEGWIMVRQPVNGHGVWITRTIWGLLDRWQAEGKLRRVQATASEKNPKAIRLLELLGFKREGLLEAYRPDGSNSWMYARIRRDGT